MTTEEKIDSWPDFIYESGPVHPQWNGIFLKISPRITLPTTKSLEVFCDILSLVKANTHPYVVLHYNKPTPGYGKYVQWSLSGMYVVPADETTLRFFGMNNLVRRHIAGHTRKH